MLCKCCCCVSVTDNWKHFAELQRTFISQSFNMASVRAALSLSLSHSFNVMCNTGRMRVAVKAYSRCAFLIKVKPNATHFRNVRNFYIKHFHFSIYTLPFFFIIKNYNCCGRLEWQLLSAKWSVQRGRQLEVEEEKQQKRQRWLSAHFSTDNKSTRLSFNLALNIEHWIYLNCFWRHLSGSLVFGETLKNYKFNKKTKPDTD